MYQVEVPLKKRGSQTHIFTFNKKVTEKINEVEIRGKSINDVHYISLYIDNNNHWIDKRLIKQTFNSIIIDSTIFPVNLSFPRVKNKIDIHLDLKTPTDNTRCYVNLEKCLEPVNTVRAYLYEYCDNKLFYSFHKEAYEQLKNLRVYDINAKIKMFDGDNNVVEITEKDFTKVNDHLLLNSEHIDFVDKNVQLIKVYLNEEVGEKKDFLEYEFSSKIKIPQRYID